MTHFRSSYSGGSTPDFHRVPCSARHVPGHRLPGKYSSGVSPPQKKFGQIKNRTGKEMGQIKNRTVQQRSGISLTIQCKDLYAPLVQGGAAIISGRSSDFRINLLAASSRSIWPVSIAAVVPGYSGGPVPDFHEVPVLCPSGHLKFMVEQIRNSLKKLKEEVKQKKQKRIIRPGASRQNLLKPGILLDIRALSVNISCCTGAAVRHNKGTTLKSWTGPPL